MIYKFKGLNTKYSAFTLIELLVVISIIGILIAISIFGLQNARQESRDAKRKTDLQTIRSGLEIYRSDCGSYPASLGLTLTGSCPDTNTYIAEVPSDPVTGSSYPYSTSDGLTYILCAKLEQTPVSPDNCAPLCSSCNYMVKNP